MQHSDYISGLVDIFVKGTAWVAEPLVPGGRGLKMCSMFTHVINCTVCYSISSSSMEINVPLGTNCLARSWVLWCSAQPSKTVYSQLPMIKVQATLVDRLKKSKFCVRGEGASVSGCMLVKRTGLTLHDPITSARRLSFLQNCHHYCFLVLIRVCACVQEICLACVWRICVCAADLSTGGFY